MHSHSFVIMQTTSFSAIARTISMNKRRSIPSTRYILDTQSQSQTLFQPFNIQRTLIDSFLIGKEMHSLPNQHNTRPHCSRKTGVIVQTVKIHNMLSRLQNRLNTGPGALSKVPIQSVRNNTKTPHLHMNGLIRFPHFGEPFF